MLRNTLRRVLAPNNHIFTLSTHKQHTTLSSAQSSLKDNILPLRQLIAFRKKSSPRERFINNYDEVLKFGCHPLQFRNQLYVYFKEGYWNSSSDGQTNLLQFIQQMNQQSASATQILALDANESSAAELMQKIECYQRQLSKTILPKPIYKMQICQPYLQQLIQFLKQPQPLTQIAITVITKNLDSIVFPDEEEWEYLSERDSALTLLTAFDTLINKIAPIIHTLTTQQKQRVISMGKALRSNNLILLQFIKHELQKQKKVISLKYFLIGLNLLSINQSFPYEYFYNNKDSLMSFVEASYNLSDKKVKNSILMLQIFSRQRLMFCEKIVDRLLICIELNLAAINIQQLTRLFYFYSRLKNSIKHQFVVKIVERIYLFMNQLRDQDYALIVKAVANLNYDNRELVQKLKEFNYQLFLANLKYDCKHPGSLYQAILDQVQTQFRRERTTFSLGEGNLKVQTQEVSN